MLAGLRRFFGFDAGGEEDSVEFLTSPPDIHPSPPVGGAFRIGEKLSIKGEIEGEGDLELAGRFEGLIHVSGRVVVGERAEVDADISATTIVVGGKGVLTGNLKSGSFAAADGALVKGEIVIERSGRSKLDVGAQP